MLDAVRLGPADDATAVTAAQLRDVVDRLIAAGHWQPGDPNILIVIDAGYDVTRLAFVLADLPVELVGRLRSDRVLRLPEAAPAARHDRPPAQARPGVRPGQARPPGPTPQHTTSTDTTRYGTAVATSWDRVHPRLTHRGCWLDHDGELPVIEGTLIRLQVEHLPGDRDPETACGCGPPPPAPPPADVDRCVAGVPAPLRPRTHLPAVQADPRLDRPEDPRPRSAADRWTWLIIAAHTQLRLARPWPPTCAGPGRDPPARAGSPPPGSAAGFGTSARRPPSPPAHRNPADPAPDAHPAPATDTPQPATTSARPSNATGPSPHDKSAQVKDQAENVPSNAWARCGLSVDVASASGCRWSLAPPTVGGRDRGGRAERRMGCDGAARGAVMLSGVWLMLRSGAAGAPRGGLSHSVGDRRTLHNSCDSPTQCATARRVCDRPTGVR